MSKFAPFKVGRGPGSDDGATYLYNGKYQVCLRVLTDREGVQHTMISVRREDCRPIADWRDVQLIKNAVLGPEEEMVQVFPAESRLVDTSNQFWFYHYPGRRWPFGFTDRMVTEGIQVRVPGGQYSQQRPFAPEHRPADLEEQEARAQAMWADLQFRVAGGPD